MSEQTEQLTELANRISRSTIAVVDAVTQRGGFKRDQCVQAVSLIESIQQEDALNVDDDE